MRTMGSARGEGREWLVTGDRRRAAVVAAGRRGKESEIVVRPRGTQPWGMAESVAGEGKETMAGQRGLMIGGKEGQPSAQRSWLPTAGVGVLAGKGSSCRRLRGGLLARKQGGLAGEKKR
ncbi:hypothetical protein OIU79_024604 [Salix purpurea]|uniref:Uncharacterized protein n=1 Tax=Salix purpurea TaxID=77065 RepID=A0A9Q0WBX5_SALPP|nr:hypothetical protein OIU79_024604 [Salix purpurea]